MGGGVERRVGEARERQGRAAGVELAAEIRERDLDGDPGLGAAERARERLVGLVVARRGERLIPGVGDLGARDLRRRRAAREEDEVAELGMIGDGLADERARAERLDEPADRAFVIGEEPRVDARMPDAREDPPEIARRLLGIGRVDRRVEHGLGELREAFAGARAERRIGVARELEQIGADLAPAIRVDSMR